MNITSNTIEKNIELIKSGKLTKEEVIKEYEREKKIYSDCKDGSAAQTSFECFKMKEAIKKLENGN